MAAITHARTPELVVYKTGQHGFRELYGIGAFNSTDATGTLAVPGFQEIYSVNLSPVGAPATDETLYGPAPSGGKIAPSSNAITVGRTGASPTSGLSFSFIVRGR